MVGETSAGPYDRDGMPFLKDFLQKHRPDIVTLQEVHGDEAESQARTLAEALGYTAVWRGISPSHIDPGKRLGIAVLSGFPIEGETFGLFPNPQWQLTRPDGEVWNSHDKGFLRCVVRLTSDRVLGVTTLHLFPFRKYGVDPFGPSATGVRAALSEALGGEAEPWLLQGDFNVNAPSLETFLPDLFSCGARTFPLPGPTTPRDRCYDHVVYRGLRPVAFRIVQDVPTDHFPLLCDFEVS